MVFLFVRWIFSCLGVALGPARPMGRATTFAGARGQIGPRTSICDGCPGGGVALERAVSRPGKPETGPSVSAAFAYGGRCRSRWNLSHKPIRYEPTKPTDPAAVFSVAGAALHRLPGETG